jgi:hypothetical protein
MLHRTKIFVIYEKPEAAEPVERVELLRDGFSLFAFALHFLWLLYHRLWLFAGAYFLVMIALYFSAQALDMPEYLVMFAQFWLQLLLGYHATDLRAWRLKRRGYRMSGVLAAPSETEAARRYYEYAA